MKKIKKLLTAITVVLTITASSVPVQCVFGVQDTVQAAEIKLNKTSIVLNTGESTKLKIAGTKKRAKWSTSNKFVASVNSNGAVSGANAGTAYIYAEVSGKKLKCKVTVKNSFDEAKAKKNIKKTIYENNGNIFVLMKSNYEFPTSVTAHCYFYDVNDKPIDTGYSYFFWLEKGREGVLSFQCTDDYSSYEIKYDYFQSFAYVGNESVIDKLSVDTNEVKDGYFDKIMVTLNNNSNKEISCNVIIKYYDGNGKIVYIDEIPFYDVDPKEHEIDEVYKRVEYSYFEALISTATYDK